MQWSVISVVCSLLVLGGDQLMLSEFVGLGTPFDAIGGLFK
jgi:hypothetical protein